MFSIKQNKFSIFDALGLKFITPHYFGFFELNILPDFHYGVFFL